LSRACQAHGANMVYTRGMKTRRICLTLIALWLLAPACGTSNETQGEYYSDTETIGGDAEGVPSSGDSERPTRDQQSDASAIVDVERNDAPLRPDLAWDVTSDGPYEAGHRRLETSYFSQSTGAERTISFEVWYPTEDSEGESVFYAEIFADENVLGEAALAAPVAGDTYPLHVHSHGNLGYAGSSPYVMRHFATHGWVVVAPAHKGNTIIDNISPRPVWMYTVRAEDVSATLDALAALPESDPLFGKLDTEQALLSGHSYGAYTTFGLTGASFNPERVAELCPEGEESECSDAVEAFFAEGLRDERFVGSIPMAPGSYDMYAEGLGDVAIPTMHMTGSDDRPEANVDIWAALPAPSYRVHVEGGCHQLFALGGCELIDDDPGLMIINAYALAFGRHVLLEDESVAALLDGSDVLDPAVTFLSK